MAKVEIYTSAWCGFCSRAKSCLERHNVEYQEYDVTMGGPIRAEMEARAPGARTVPQIFIDDISIGGSDDLAALDASGELSQLLQR
jgi:glutaredoxin 3